MCSLQSVAGMDHSELVAEMPHVERLSVQERLHLARRRRLQQLRAWAQREKEWSKRQQQNKLNGKKRIFFDSSVVLLEAAARNDINEGKLTLLEIFLTKYNDIIKQRLGSKND
jgi:protein phosphatase 1 regulatory subunit 16A